MKKATAAVGAIVLLGAAWLGATWYIGKRTETVYAAAFKQGNARIGQLLGHVTAARPGLHLESYERGFFTSSAVYNLHIKDAGGRPVEIRLRDHIQHGPFPAGSLASGYVMPVLAHIQTGLLATPYTRAWVDSQPDGTPATGSTTVRLSGDSSSAWAFRPATFATRHGVRIAFGGGTMQLDFRNQFRDNDAAGLFQTLSATDNASGGTVSMKDIRLNGNTRTGENNAIISASEARVDTVVIDGGAAETGDDIVLRQIGAQVDSTQSGKLLDTVHRYDIGSVVAGGLDLGSLAVGGRLNRLDIPALMALGTEYDAILARQGVTDPAKAVLTPSDQQRLNDRILELLISRPSLLLEPVIWKNAQGQATGSLLFDFAAPDPAALQSAQIVPAFVRKAGLKLSVSRPMVVEVFRHLRQEGVDEAELKLIGGMLFDQYAGRLQQAGLVKLNDGTASTNMVYEANAMQVNGVVMPMQEFLMRAMLLFM
ncbi:DUF945 family protein [Pusillimonas sp. TS35]|uniref:YdgA family protein n=1 Tax=Paracandidimonas lactea TaxID=2895524 RepID=UPI0013714D1C|nr:DUF945 family protein [Pusillimonas sp. TS35]